MCSINHDLKAIYIHIPKCGGLFTQKVLGEYYGFKTYYFTHESHEDYTESDTESIPHGFLKIRKGGILRYFMSSKEHNEKTGMTPEKWSEYKKFTVVRNPYDKFISAYKYIQKDSVCVNECITKKDPNCINETINEFISKKDSMSNYPFFHSFITQHDHLLDINNEIHIDYYINFHNLNTELCDVLLDLGVEQIKHRNYILNNKKANVSKTDNYSNYYDEETLTFVNEHFKNDFKFLPFPMLETVEDLKKDSDNYYVTPREFTKKNIDLLIDLDKRNAICEFENFIVNETIMNNEMITTDNGMSIKIEKNKVAPKMTPEIFNMLMERLVLKNGGKILPRTETK